MVFYLENFLYGPLGKRREKNLLATWRTSQIRVRRAKSSSAQEDGLTCLSLWIFSMCPDNLVVCWSQFSKWRAQAWMCCPPGHTESVVKGVVREQIIPTCSCTAQTCPHLDMMLNQVLPKPSIQSLYNFFFLNSESVSQPCFTCPECKYPSFEFWTQPAQSEVSLLLHCGAWDQMKILVCTNLSKERSLITGSSCWCPYKLLHYLILLNAIF